MYLVPGQFVQKYHCTGAIGILLSAGNVSGFKNGFLSDVSVLYWLSSSQRIPVCPLKKNYFSVAENLLLLFEANSHSIKLKSFFILLSAEEKGATLFDRAKLIDGIAFLQTCRCSFNKN